VRVRGQPPDPPAGRAVQLRAHGAQGPGRARVHRACASERGKRWRFSD
jgi:hypothetical protein